MRPVIQSATGTFDPWSIPVFNTTGETVPPHAVMQIIGASMVGDDVVYRIGKPSGAANAKYLVNSPAFINANSDGFGTDLYPTDALVTGNPLFGQEWGPVAGSWALSINGKGFLILGGVAGGVARVASIPPSAGQGADFPVIHLRNDSGLPRPAWSIFRTSVPLSAVPLAPIQPTFASLAPLEGKPFAVTFAAVGTDPENNIVDAAQIGPVLVQLDYTDAAHEKAECITGDYSKLKSVTDGPATILWRERELLVGPPSLGLQWAYVLLDRQGGAGTATVKQYTAAMAGTIAKGGASNPTSGPGQVYEVLPGGVTAPLDGTKTLWNPFEFDITGNCSVGRINDEHFLILGDIEAECMTETVVTNVQCINGELVITTKQIKFLSAPCPS